MIDDGLREEHRAHRNRLSDRPLRLLLPVFASFPSIIARCPIDITNMIERIPRLGLDFTGA